MTAICWVCDERPIRADAPRTGCVGREADLGCLIYCVECAAALKSALSGSKP